MYHTIHQISYYIDIPPELDKCGKGMHFGDAVDSKNQ